ncbi:PAS domain S-box protein, partial [Candidatus Dependentiae bacterium]|nr:PAS domain S-box protein [Candidatus Dependentiae bacterium]
GESGDSGETEFISNFITRLMNCRNADCFENLIFENTLDLTFIRSAMLFYQEHDDPNTLTSSSIAIRKKGKVSISSTDIQLTLDIPITGLTIIPYQKILKYFNTIPKDYNNNSQLVLLEMSQKLRNKKSILCLEFPEITEISGNHFNLFNQMITILDNYLGRFQTFHSAIEDTIKLSYLIEINKLLTSTLNWSVLVKNILFYLSKLLNSDIGILFIKEPSSDYLHFEDISGDKINISNKFELIRNFKLLTNELITDTSQLKGVIKITHPNDFPKEFLDALKKCGVESISESLISPIFIKGELSAVLLAANRTEENKFKKIEMQLISSFSQIVGHALMNASSFKNVRNQFDQALKHSREITNRKDSLESFFESINDGIIVTNKFGKIIEINSTALEIFNLPDKAEVLNKSYEDILKSHFDNNSFNIPDLYSKIGKAEESPIEFKIGELYYYINIGLMTDDEGKETGMVLVFEDISRYKKVEELKTEFISSLSHELKTPLTSIIGGVKILKKKFKNDPDEDNKKLIDIIAVDSEHLLNQIEDLLRLSRFEVQKEIFSPRLFDITEVIKRIEKTFDNDLKSKMIKIKTEITTKQFNGDKDKIYHLLSNLISNSIKYNKPEGFINVIIKDENNKQIISIEDSGIGIQNDKLKRLFEPFFRIEKRHHNIPGTGLGLSICKKIMDLHQGEIKVQSQLNSGTKFLCIFPFDYSGVQIEKE